MYLKDIAQMLGGFFIIILIMLAFNHIDQRLLNKQIQHDQHYGID